MAQTKAIRQPKLLLTHAEYEHHMPAIFTTASFIAIYWETLYVSINKITLCKEQNIHLHDCTYVHVHRDTRTTYLAAELLGCTWLQSVANYTTTSQNILRNPLVTSVQQET